MNRETYPNDTETSFEEIIKEMNRDPQYHQSFTLGGIWYQSQPPSAERLQKFRKLAEVLIFDHDNFLDALIGAYQEDDLDYQTALELVRDGKITDSTTFIEVAEMLGAITCAN